MLLKELSHGMLKTGFLQVKKSYSVLIQRMSLQNGISILILSTEIVHFVTSCTYKICEGTRAFVVYNLPGIFSGNLSSDVSEGSRWNISRSGFCGMRSKKFDGFIDLNHRIQ